MNGHFPLTIRRHSYQKLKNSRTWSSLTEDAMPETWTVVLADMVRIGCRKSTSDVCRTYI
jgi:hypothetical protein